MPIMPLTPWEEQWLKGWFLGRAGSECWILLHCNILLCFGLPRHLFSGTHLYHAFLPSQTLSTFYFSQQTPQSQWLWHCLNRVEFPFWSQFASITNRISLGIDKKKGRRMRWVWPCFCMHCFKVTYLPEHLLVKLPFGQRENSWHTDVWDSYKPRSLFISLGLMDGSLFSNPRQSMSTEDLRLTVAFCETPLAFRNPYV